ncbi:Aspartate racemase [Pigmentiphaga humi]|uniref:Aspartate racemase n=1 Tax=Pigmentiphaga humi TaxID=2478468 RepID=A0A3P4B716_9BURK|nr:amino acid racemase [Pigmentiphaga humi]VCU71400.1 Aspartate racemase [Pigmentiphaga humi]
MKPDNGVLAHGAGRASPPRLVGVLGGMGPLATVDFMQRLIDLAGAGTDQQHIPAVVAQIPQIPDRVGAILSATESPLPQLTESLRRLERAGADLIVMPCNTAHYWYPELAAATDLPFLNIVDAVIDVLAGHGLEPGSRVGLLATRATLAAGVYAERDGVQFVAPEESELRDLLLPCIALVKEGRVQEAGGLLTQCVASMRARGVEHIVLGCTELPLALKAAGMSLDDGFVDSTTALAQAAIAAARAGPA